MKIKIEADLRVQHVDALSIIAEALQKEDLLEFLRVEVKAAESFQISFGVEMGSIFITKM